MQFRGWAVGKAGRRVFVLLLGYLLAISATATPLELPFQLDSRHDAILISAEINGKPATLIVDTGATQTVLDARLLGISRFDLKASGFSRSGPGFRGEAVWSEARLKLGQRVWHEQRVVAMNLEEFTPRYGRVIHGLLGQDILRQFDRVTIDFKRRIISLEQ